MRNPSPRALSIEEANAVLSVMHEERFIDQAPSEIYATLLDEGRYLCSIRTMYRILHANKEIRERRNILRHPNYTKPELLARAPNEVWSWDITKLKGPETWTKYYLYVLMDIFSRYVVGWMIAERELAELAKELIEQTCQRQNIDENKLIIHSDRGPSMTSKTVALLLSDLGVTRSLSRPYVSDDNPFSESHFKTLKYRPEFPPRFGSIQDARAFCRVFFDWYNREHYHSGIALLTPATVHFGRAQSVIRDRQLVLKRAFEEHPERFVQKHPRIIQLPSEVWINPPKKSGTVCDTTTPQSEEVVTLNSGLILSHSH